MKKHLLSISAIGMAMASSLCAQSLFDLAPDDDQSESLPLRFTAGVNFGYDDNPTPLLGDSDESVYGQAYVGAAFLNNTPQSTLNVGAQIGVIHYFDDLDRGVDETSFTASLYVNWTHRISERLRFVTRNYVAYELEPDYSTGFQSQRQTGNYTRYSTDNAIGYRWTDRLATYTGIRFDGIVYDDIDGGDRSTWTVYNDFRYQLSETTVATLTVRYSETDGDGRVSDSENIYVLAGLEHRFSPQTSGTIRAGVQIRDVDGGASSDSPYLEASLNTQVNEQFKLRGYARYGVEDYSRSLTTIPGDVFSVYSGSDTLRIGFSANYAVSQDLSLVGGVNYAMLSYEDRILSIGGVGANSVDEDLLNAYIGFNLGLTDNIMLNARYNYEDFSSDAGRDYDRNRFSLGVSTQF